MPQSTPTFYKDGKRRIKCPACGRYLMDTYLGEKKDRIKKCANCGSFLKLKPPLKFHGVVDGKEDDWIAFGPNQGMFTADLTESDYDVTILE